MVEDFVAARKDVMFAPLTPHSGLSPMMRAVLAKRKEDAKKT